MRALTPEEVLLVWDRASIQSPLERSITILATVCPDLPVDALARLPIGRRDGMLLTLRERTLGSALSSLADCPRCGQTLELALSTGDLRVAEGPEVDAVIVEAGGRTLRFRLPGTLDLVAASKAPDAMSARRLLLERCAPPRDDEDRAVDVAAFDDDLFAAAAKSMSDADPQADMQLAMTCPECAHEWLAPFDIAAFFWEELEVGARRLMLEVHELASAYGWSEASILAMTASRRHAYLEFARA